MTDEQTVLDNSSIIFSRNDIQRGLIIPSVLTKDLAEEIGIHVGDGYMNIKRYSRQFKSVYEITSNHNERDYVELHVVPLIQRLYNLTPKIRENHNASSCYVLSKGLCEFKKKLGLPVGRKGNVEIPRVVLESAFICDFLRGLFDTDGCLRLYFRNKLAPPYPCLDISSQSKKLIEQVGEVLLGMGFSFCICSRKEKHYKSGAECVTWRIFLYGRKNLVLWTNLIGFSNPKNLRKIEKIARGEI